MENKKPDWLKIRIPGGNGYRSVRRTLTDLRLNTVCEHARCPNLGECWASGTATFMILGDTCTRGCRFCAVGLEGHLGAEDCDEPRRVAAAAEVMKVKHAVITSVTRDDLPDFGAQIFADTVVAVKKLTPPPTIELLIPDILGDDLKRILDVGPEVLAHNIEVVERLTPTLRHRAFSYRRSLQVLQEAKGYRSGVLTKSSIMLGIGERESEVLRAMKDLRDVDVDILVLGQYLRPTRECVAVAAYVSPERFKYYKKQALTLGFAFVAASPLARTSYKAQEAIAACAK